MICVIIWAMKNNSFYKVWEVLKPFIIYYIAYNIAFLLIAYLCHAAMEYFGTGFQDFMTARAETVTELVNSISMLIAVLPLVPMLRKELSIRNENAGDELIRKAEDSSYTKNRVGAVVLTIVLAASSSVGLNSLLSLTGLVHASAAYQDVANQQYSVVFVVGAVLFGLISPITEEIVFRGLVFNRMRRYYPTIAAIIMSGVLFGVYHGNLVQGVYGGCMGILLAYTYERLNSFLIPCLFHATANLMVYSLAQNAEVHAQLFTVPGCIILLVISAVCIYTIDKAD